MDYLHVRFSKIVLGVNKKKVKYSRGNLVGTPFSLICFKERVVKYWIKIVKNDSSTQYRIFIAQLNCNNVKCWDTRNPLLHRYSF